MKGVKKTLLMEQVMDQVRLAVIEDGALCELFHQRPGSEDLTGNIYLGRVENVLPGMNAAFVDIGLDKKGFLAAGDAPAEGAFDRSRIETMARPGQEILVQVVKSQPGAKGPRLSGHLSLPGRLMALLPDTRYVGVSKKIQDDTERARLRGIGLGLSAQGGVGLILRTAAAGASAEAISSEYAGLRAMLGDLSRRAEHLIAPRLLHDDNDLALRAVRDMLSEDVEAIWADDRECYDRLAECAAALAPQLRGRIRLHEGQTPLFDLYRVDAQADRALERYVWLKSGASLVIDEAEALTVIDVNTGKNTGTRSAGETILKTNREAATELMRQLRLRDIGGIVVVDFIDMKQEDDRQALLALLRELAARDRNRTTVVDITPLGLVELTRKRVRQSLARQLTHTCESCGGNGVVPGYEATARRAIREIWRRRRGGDGTPLLLEARPEVCGWARKIGVPEGGTLSMRPLEQMKAGEYHIAPFDGAPTHKEQDS